jgi:hypothetical protein
METIVLALLDYLITIQEVNAINDKKTKAVKEQRFDDASILRSQENVLLKSILTLDELKALRDKLTSVKTKEDIIENIESQEWSQKKVDEVKEFIKENGGKRLPDRKLRNELLGAKYLEEDRLRKLIANRRNEMNRDNVIHPSQKAAILRELKRFESWL